MARLKQTGGEVAATVVPSPPQSQPSIARL